MITLCKVNLQQKGSHTKPFSQDLAIPHLDLSHLLLCIMESIRFGLKVAEEESTLYHIPRKNATKTNRGRLFKASLA